MVDINELKFDEKGLIPAVMVDVYTREVLTVAYMNRERTAPPATPVRKAASTTPSGPARPCKTSP